MRKLEYAITNAIFQAYASTSEKSERVRISNVIFSKLGHTFVNNALIWSNGFDDPAIEDHPEVAALFKDLKAPAPADASEELF